MTDNLLEASQECNLHLFLGELRGSIFTRVKGMTGRRGKEMRKPNLKSQPLKVNYLFQSFDGVYSPECQLDIEKTHRKVFGMRKIS